MLAKRNGVGKRSRIGNDHIVIQTIAVRTRRKSLNNRSCLPITRSIEGPRGRVC